MRPAWSPFEWASWLRAHAVDGADYVCSCGRLRPPGTACVCGR